MNGGAWKTETPEWKGDWGKYRQWCQKIWEEGPRKVQLRKVWQRIRDTHEQWRREGKSSWIPDWQEGGQKGRIGEIYVLIHLGSGKLYVGMSYHGAAERMKGHWRQRNEATDPCHRLMALSENVSEWIIWPVQRSTEARRGYLEFHKRASHWEGWWIEQLKCWWPGGLNVGSTGLWSKVGTREDWRKHRETAEAEWRRKTETESREWRKEMNRVANNVLQKGTEEWKEIKKWDEDQIRGAMMLLTQNASEGGNLRREWLLRLRSLWGGNGNKQEKNRMETS